VFWWCSRASSFHWLNFGPSARRHCTRQTSRYKHACGTTPNMSGPATVMLCLKIKPTVFVGFKHMIGHSKQSPSYRAENDTQHHPSSCTCQPHASLRRTIDVGPRTSQVRTTTSRLAAPISSLAQHPAQISVAAEEVQLFDAGKGNQTPHPRTIGLPDQRLRLAFCCLTLFFNSLAGFNFLFPSFNISCRVSVIEACVRLRQPHLTHFLPSHLGADESPALA
jgi:hypothetical protein